VVSCNILCIILISAIRVSWSDHFILHLFTRTILRWTARVTISSFCRVFHRLASSSSSSGPNVPLITLNLCFSLRNVPVYLLVRLLTIHFHGLVACIAFLLNWGLSSTGKGILFFSRLCPHVHCKFLFCWLFTFRIWTFRCDESVGPLRTRTTEFDHWT
jgi:hypothetical protein